MDSVPAPGKSSRFAWVQTWTGILTLGFFALVILAALAYVEEDWRGERVWQNTKAELEARGESFDRATFIPPQVPDGQNFGALPYFQPVSGRMRITNSLDTVNSKLPSSKDDGKEKGSLPYLPNWRKGETADLAAIEKQLMDYLHAHAPTVQVAQDATPLDIFTKICPVLADLRQANARLPLCRFVLDYDNPKPWMIMLGPTTDHIRLAKILSYDSKLALLSHRPEIALEDSQVVWKIYSGLSQEPLLVCGLVGLGVMAIQLDVVERGLFDHDWNDAQLAQIDNDLAKIDALSEAQLCLRGDLTMFLNPIADAIVANRSMLIKELSVGGGSFDYKEWESWQALGVKMFYTYVPKGWLRMNEADTMRRILDGVRAIDPTARRVYPQREEALLPNSENEDTSFLSVAVGPMLEGIRKFAYFQAQVDMARIACRLERYRLAHGTFPATLDALVPTYGAELPHDIMNGQPYIYRLDTDGNYTLYSVGWNQKDDHGDISDPSSPTTPYSTDRSADWVWTNHPLKKK